MAFSPIFLYSSEDKDIFSLPFLSRLLFVFPEKIFPKDFLPGVSFLKKWFLPAATGFFAGILNGLFGSGGGIIAVPLFEKSNLSQKESHATALLMMLCLSAFSAFLYFENGEADFSDAAVFLPGGIVGAFAAAMVFRKIDPLLLRKIFGGFVAFSAGRMLFGVVAEWL